MCCVCVYRLHRNGTKNMPMQSDDVTNLVVSIRPERRSHQVSCAIETNRKCLSTEFITSDGYYLEG